VDEKKNNGYEKGFEMLNDKRLGQEMSSCNVETLTMERFCGCPKTLAK
jgi:hypothetical protein